MNVTVMSRKNAIAYCKQKNPEDSVMISISDPRLAYMDEPFRSDENKVTDILRLCFADADGAGLDVYGNSVEESDLMTDEDARMVAEFVNRHQDVYILVHCDAGISRSAGVAAAILKHYTGDDRQIFKSSRHYPNMWCYRKTLNALHDLFPQEDDSRQERGNLLSNQQYQRLSELRKRVADAISKTEYEDKCKNQLEGSLELSCVFPAIAADATGTAPANEWEIQLVCHFDPERPFMSWYGRTVEEALSDCECDVEELIGRMEAARKG